jgi:glutamate-1-semialdehyde 2,1-aminomutase
MIPATPPAVLAALEAARAAYSARYTASAAQHARAREVLPGGNTRSVLYASPFPIAIARGEDAQLWDLDGNRYVDLLGEYTAGLFGHSHPAIQAAVRAALDDGINLGAHTVAEERFARAVTERFPAMELLRFTNSGTEANLLAIATACATSGRREILVFNGGYHGGVLTFGVGVGGPLNAPYHVHFARFNAAESAAELIRARGEQLAAVIVEPMQGGGGCIPATPAFLQRLRAETEATGALLILDEVMTSRLAPHGLGAALGVRPDLMTLGKYVGGGMSFGAFGGRRDLMSRFDPAQPGAFAHAGTFNNNVLTMRAGYVGLSEVYTPAAVATLNARGERLRHELNTVCRAHEAPLQFTGIGSMLCWHTTAASITAPEDTALADPALKALIFFDLLEAGFWVAQRGFLALSLAVSDDDCTRFVAAVEQILRERAALFEAVRTAQEQG